MDVRQATPEEEAVMNMELFKTEEVFTERMKVVLLRLLREDADVQNAVDILMHRRLQTHKESLAGNISSAIRNSY